MFMFMFMSTILQTKRAINKSISISMVSAQSGCQTNKNEAIYSGAWRP